MNRKSQKNKAIIGNVDPELVTLLDQYAYKNYETRGYSNGKGMLYIRMTRIVPPVKLRVA